MATITQVDFTIEAYAEDPAARIARMLEEHFDEMGWDDEERNRRAASAGARMDAAVARANSAE